MESLRRVATSQIQGSDTTHTFLILMGRVVFPTVWALRSRKVRSSLSPPPSLLTALLVFSPSTLRVIEFGALTGRLDRVIRADDDSPLGRFPDDMALSIICLAFVVGFEGRPDVVAGFLDRAGPLAAGWLERLRPPEASISRSPSRSTLAGPPARRLAMPPRCVFPPPGALCEVEALFRGPEGAMAVANRNCAVRNREVRR